jgi:glycosyltransferase involved in cell wall biosynthesis
LSANKNGQRPSVAVLLSGREQFSSYFGGAVARWTYEVYRRLDEQVSVTVFGFPSAKKGMYELPHKTSPAWRLCSLVSRVPGVRRYEETLWLRALAGKLRNYNVIHVHNRPQWVARLRKLGYREAIVLHLHNDHVGHWPSPTLDKLASELDVLAVCSEYLRSRFATKSASLDAKTRVVHNGADLNLFYPREEIRERKTILFVGVLNQQKGVLQLLRAYERVLDAHPDARLVIGGGNSYGKDLETPYIRQVREFAQQLRNGKHADVKFTGYLDHATDLPQHFQKATVFTCPSLYHEAFAIVNAEAMACATAVVAANRAGIPEVIGNAGLLVDPENADQFGSAISELLSRPEERQRLGQAGYDRCRRMFDWRITAENWMNLLDTCC